MFVVDDILISDALLDAPFTCNLGACLGGCCVQGEAGAPLEPEERERLEAALPRVRKYLRPEALAVIEERGVWEEDEPGKFATPCIDGAECVFVRYEGPVAKCALQKAYHEGRIDFPKPISCHLYPIRIEQLGGFEALNYEQIDLCAPGRALGQRNGLQLVDFLQEPLERKYGPEWFATFRATWQARRTTIYPALAAEEGM